MASYQSTNNAFPAFYSRKSGSSAPYNFSSALEAAEAINSNLNLGLRSGILIAAPVPEKWAMDGMYFSFILLIFFSMDWTFLESDINLAIKNALEIAETNDIRGKEITPFLLSRISEMTKGRSLQTSILFYIFIMLGIGGRES